ncbi:MAG: hypothetical protein ACREGR_04640 [Minisyncoccia bacterium]
MAKGTKFTVSVNGRVETRTSERAYTHVVLVLKDGLKRKAYVEAPYQGVDLKRMQESWEGIMKYVGGEWVPSTLVPWTGDDWLMSVDRKERRNRMMPLTPLVIKASTKADYEAEAKDGFDAWLARNHAERIAQFHKDVKDGRFLWHVMGWSQSERNANKMPRTGYYDQHKVVPVGTVITLPGDYRG